MSALRTVVLLVCLALLASVNAIQRPQHLLNQLTKNRAVSVASLLDSERLWGNTKSMLVTRVAGSPNHAKVREQIVAHFQGLAWDVELDTFTENTPIGQKQFTNIIATFDTGASRRLVLAAHYDSKYFPGINRFVGATDSAAPCAMLMEVASMVTSRLRERGTFNDLTLQFIFFDGEEAFVQWSETDSLYGSRHLAELLSNRPLRRTKRRGELDDPEITSYGGPELGAMDVLVLLDLLGHRDAAVYPAFEDTVWLHERLAVIEAQLAQENQLREFGSPVFRTQLLPPHYRVDDDHAPFLRRNVPVVHLIATPFPAVWHTFSDNEAALHRPTMENIAKVLAVLVYEYLHA
eukprot:Colp12_sorted_trinity150504_noHs@31285